MFKKSETGFTPEESSTPSTPDPAEFTTSDEAAVIGPSIKLKGDVTGSQDLLVEGGVEGNIKLPKNAVTVGRTGKVNATIHAGVIVVEGNVEGDLRGEEQIIIRRSGNVLGNLTAPRVGLEDGAQFKGNIDMEPKTASKPHTPPTTGSKPDNKPSPGLGLDKKHGDK